jgi:hypothetical protein
MWLFEGLDADEHQRVKRLALDAGLRSRQSEDSILWRSEQPHPRFIVAHDLFNAEGQLRADATTHIQGPAHDAEAAAETRESIRALLDAHKIKEFPTNLHVATFAFLTEEDTVGVVKWLQEQYDNGLRVTRLRATDAWQKREVFWRWFGAALDQEVSLKDLMASGGPGPVDGMTDMISVYPALLVTAPLVSRSQPLAAVFMNSTQAELVAQPPQGGWIRPPSIGGFPTSLGGPQGFLGSGKGVYATDLNEIPDEWSGPWFNTLVEAANRQVNHLTDPSVWRTESGAMDQTEQAIGYATIRLGLGTLHEMGRDWGEADLVWTAFRSLGTLSGFWETKGNPSLLKYLVDPRVVREFALPTNLPPSYRQWCIDILDLYEQELSRVFPDRTLDEALTALVEVRNLVHGVAAMPSKRRARRERLDVLRDRGDGSLVHLLDLATMWWTATILEPQTMLRPQRPPFPI